MTEYRTALPLMNGDLFLTDGGMETTLVFHQGLELPHFAAFHLLQTDDGTEALRQYYRSYADVAVQLGVGLVIDGATWRANRDWGQRLGYTPNALREANQKAITLVEEIRAEYESKLPAVVVGGCVGPRGDGYTPSQLMSIKSAERYHLEQIETFAETAADLVCAMTLNYTEEAIGIARAAQIADVPVVLSFTVETDGRLPSGHSLQSAIEAVDDATDHYTSYFMINCAHPSHFQSILATDAPWLDRIGGLRANASKLSHAELDESEELDTGNPRELAQEHIPIKQRLRNLNVLGGCCGTDHQHVAAIAEACQPLFQS